MTTLNFQIPDEPPEYTIVVTGSSGDGRAWMRDDPLGNRSTGWWHPAGSYYDDHGRETNTPLRWYALVGKYRHFTVLRWGNGQDSAHPPYVDLAEHAMELQRLGDLVAELRLQLGGALRLAQRTEGGEAT